MNLTNSSVKHITSPECRTLNALYFQNHEKQGYTFITLFEIDPKNGTFIPTIQVGDFKNLAERNTLIILRKTNDSIKVMRVDSTRCLRVDEFELIRRCVDSHKNLEDLMRACTFNPVADTVYKWLIEARREHRLYSKDFYEEIRKAFIEADLESLYETNWLK